MPVPEEVDLHEPNIDGRRRQRANTAITIALIGWLIIGFSINSIIFNSFPIRLTDPEWQLDLITKLLSSSLSLLFGASLITLSQAISSREKIIKDWNRAATKLASLLAVVLVLTIPLQFYIGSRSLKNQTIGTYEAINNLKSILKGVNSVNSEAEFRAYVGSIPNQPNLPAVLDAPFPVIKQRSIDNLKAKINTLTENIELQKSQALQIFLKEAVRNTAQSILMAAAFSALAGLNPRSTNMVTRMFEKLL